MSGYYFIGEKFRSAQLPRMRPPPPARLGKIYPGSPASELHQGHPVFIDFTAAWCITCKFNESTVLETAAVRAAFPSTKS